jgi:predicted RNase H-like nuclease (RuvC/YqgF family)
MDRPDEIKEKLQTYNQQYNFALEDYTNAYVTYNMFPNNTEYQNILSNTQGTLDNTDANLFTTTNDIKSNIEKLSEELLQMNNKIKEEKQINKDLLKMKNRISSDENSSDIMMIDSKTIYKSQRLTNFMLLVGIFLLLGVISRI